MEDVVGNKTEVISVTLKIIMDIRDIDEVTTNIFLWNLAVFMLRTS